MIYKPVWHAWSGFTKLENLVICPMIVHTNNAAYRSPFNLIFFFWLSLLITISLLVTCIHVPVLNIKFQGTTVSLHRPMIPIMLNHNFKIFSPKWFHVEMWNCEVPQYITGSTAQVYGKVVKLFRELNLQWVIHPSILKVTPCIKQFPCELNIMWKDFCNILSLPCFWFDQ